MMAFFRVCSAALASSLLIATEASVDLTVAESALAVDDECAVSGDAAQCALNALQLRGRSVASEALEVAANASLESHAGGAEGSQWIKHYAQNCWYSCHGPGMCPEFCGDGNACCRYMRSGDPKECKGVRFWPVRHMHTCVKSPMGHRYSGKVLPIYKDPRLFKPSQLPMLEFYMYRAQTNESYDPENQNMGSLAGMLWYLHNEIIQHPQLKRTGSYFSTRKTRLEKFRVKVRNTQPLYDMGMNFGVVNTFDTTKCTGPWGCDNFGWYGYTVGCEDWKSPADFPHSQWTSIMKYPGSVWYSLPGSCTSKRLSDKDEYCLKSEPGGACPGDMDPTGEGNCTYSYEKVGEISIDELEGLHDEDKFIAMKGMEYNVGTDKGVGMSFWNDKLNVHRNQERIDHANALFKAKYPKLPELADPGCNFNKYKFFPHHHWR